MSERCIVAGYGCENSYSHLAYFSFGLKDCDYENYRSFETAAAALHAGKTDYLILPLRNNCQGRIDSIDELLSAYRFTKLQEREVPIEFALFGNGNSALEKIKSVTSHPIALGQCRAFIRRRGWREVTRAETDGAVIDIVEQNDPTLAAIGPYALGLHCGARLLAYPVNDNPDNLTVFGLFERTAEAS